MVWVKNAAGRMKVAGRRMIVHNARRFNRVGRVDCLGPVNRVVQINQPRCGESDGSYNGCQYRLESFGDAIDIEMLFGVTPRVFALAAA